MLESHNTARNLVGVPPLVWSERLAGAAAIYSEYLANTEIFEHSTDVEGVEPEGENLWMGTRNAFTFDQMAAMWIDERNEPHSEDDFDHYTQIIWPDTQWIGCALSSSADDDYLVCRYSPAGNIYGENPFEGEAS